MVRELDDTVAAPVAAVGGPSRGAPDRRSHHVGGGRRRVLLLPLLGLLGLTFGAATSAVDHGFGPASEYTSTILGGAPAWLGAGLLAAWAGRTFKAAFTCARTFLLAAVIAYYVSDTARGVYTDKTLPMQGLATISWAGVVADVVGYTIVSALASLVLAVVVAIAHKRGVTGLAAAVAVPAYISYSTIRNHLHPGFDPQLGVASGWIAWPAVTVTAAVLATRVYMLATDRQRASH